MERLNLVVHVEELCNLPIFGVSKTNFAEFKEKLRETSGDMSLNVYLVLNQIYMCNCKLVVVLGK